MSTFSSFRPAVLLVALLVSWASPAFGDERTEVQATVEKFYQAYPKADDPEKFLMKSPAVSKGLRKAYTAFMKKDAGFDPIIDGQDVPSSGYAVGEVKVEGQSATVTLVPKEKGFKTLKVHLSADEKRWVIDGVNGLKGK